MRADGVVGRLAAVDGLALRRAWPRGPDRLTLEYVAPDGEVIAGQWAAEDARLGDLARATRRGAGADDVALAVAGGEGVLLQRRGADRRLPGLARVLRLPGARLVAHRAERRATVRICAGGGVAFAKIVRPGLAARVAASLAAAGVPGGPAVPRVLDVDDEHGIVVVAALGGGSLHERLGEAGADGLAIEGGRRLAALHSHASAPSGAPEHDLGAEARVLAGWVDRLRPFAPALHAGVAPAAASVIGELALLEWQRCEAIHRDLHDKQVFATDAGGAGLIDLDTLAPGDPWIDVANLAAHFELRELQGLVAAGGAARLTRAFLAGYGRDAGAERLDVLRRAAWLRLACVYAFRPRWAGLPERLLELARPVAALA